MAERDHVMLLDWSGAAAGPDHVYKLIDGLSTGRRTFGSAMTGGDGEPAWPGFMPTFAARPGEQGADRLDADRCDGAAGPRHAGARGVDHRGGRGHPRCTTPGGDEGGGRGAAAGPDAGACADAPGLVGRVRMWRCTEASGLRPGHRRPEALPPGGDAVAVLRGPVQRYTGAPQRLPKRAFIAGLIPPPPT